MSIEQLNISAETFCKNQYFVFGESKFHYQIFQLFRKINFKRKRDF